MEESPDTPKAAKVGPLRSVASSPDEATIAPQESQLGRVSSPDGMDTIVETEEPGIGDLSDQGELAGSGDELEEDFIQKLGQEGSDFAQAVEKAQAIDQGGLPLVSDVGTWYEVFVYALEGLDQAKSEKEARQAKKRRLPLHRLSSHHRLAAQQGKEAVDLQTLDKQLRERARRLADRIIFLAQVFGTDGVREVEKLTSELRQRFSGSQPSPTVAQGMEPVPRAASVTAASFVSEWRRGEGEHRFERYIRGARLYRLHESLIHEYGDPVKDTNRIMIDMGLQTATGVDVRTLCTAYLLHLIHGFPIEEIRVKFKDKDKIPNKIKRARNTISRTLHMGGLYFTCEYAFGPEAFLLLSDTT